MADPPIVVAAASRPYPGEKANGDAWTVQRQTDGCRIALIDGLGHGPAAAAAAGAAVTALEGRPQADPVEALTACHQALVGTRGAVISIAAIAPARGRLVYAGVGNVEARLCQSRRVERPIALRGILGVVMPRLRSFEFALAPDWLLLLHTDGVSAHCRLNTEGVVTASDPQAIADLMLARCLRPTDDATVIIASPTMAVTAQSWALLLR